MSRLFISHSSHDNLAALAVKQWLGRNGWPPQEVFLDLDDIGAGERWKEALRKANARCEAVILLASPEALLSPECLAEIRKAEDYGKEIIVVLLRDLQLDDRRLGSYKERQIVDLSASPRTYVEAISYRGEQSEVRFNGEALARIRDYLIKRGITPDHFAWPPEDKPNAIPFPGLAAFTEDDAGIFFGRDSDILRALDKLRVLRRDCRPRILIIHGASGAGKSSFLRAGLWPRLARDPDFSPLAILRAANGILTGPDGLGRRLSQRLSSPRLPVLAGNVHAILSSPDAPKAAKGFARLIQRAAARARKIRRVGAENARAPALILAIDQAEELFEADGAAESERFLYLLSHLLQNPPVGVEPYLLVTVRAESVDRLFQIIDHENIEKAETLLLPALPATSYRDIILRPIDILAHRGQRLVMEPALIEKLIEDTSGADALPLLAFTLSRLYQDFSAAGSITLKHYEAMGGVAGAIDKAVAAARAKPGDEPSIPPVEHEQLAQLRAAFIPWLARIDPQSGIWMRRIARLDEIPEGSRNMVRRLVKARLLVADRRSHVDVIEIAHESLLRQWPPLKEWLEAEAQNLGLIEDVERSAKLWDDNGRHQAWLDHRDERLTAADGLAARPDFRKRLGEVARQYLAACHAAERSARKRKYAIRTLVGVLAVALASGLAAWWQAPLLRQWSYWLVHVRGQVLTAERERALAPRDVFKECTQCPELVVLPAGTFLMGSLADKSEAPPHQVTIARPFAVARFELTFDEWDACAAYGDCRADVSANGWGRGRQPAINVSWDDATTYVKWLSKVTGKDYRLLSEAEWEYAARADGTATHFFFGNDEMVLGEYGWFADNANEHPHPVGEKRPNSFGLHDVYGNVSEWVADCYHDYQSGASDGSAWTIDKCTRRVIRGGSWQHRSRMLRSASRDWSTFDKGEDYIGFRVARSLTPVP